MLELRLKILDDKIDKFVISESNRTFRGKEKPFTFEENSHLFKKWKDKIIYLPIDLEEESKSEEFSKDVWLLEIRQRDALFYGIKECKNDDIIMIGDLDEIPNMDNLPNTMDIPHCFVQNFYYYYVNNKSIGPKDKFWVGTIVCNINHVNQMSPEKLRENRWGLKPIINGGWHWSYTGGESKILSKINSTTDAIPILNENNGTINTAINNVRNLKDVLGRKDMNFELVDLEHEYPQKILEILKNYPELIYKKTNL